MTFMWDALFGQYTVRLGTREHDFASSASSWKEGIYVCVEGFSVARGVLSCPRLYSALFPLLSTVIDDQVECKVTLYNLIFSGMKLSCLFDLVFFF